MGIREHISYTGSRLKILPYRIADFFTFAKKRHDKSVILKRVAKATKSPNGKLQNIEQLRPYQLDDYVEKARLLLIQTAKRRTLITYDTLMYKLNCGPGRKLGGDIVRKVSELELAEGRPRISAVVVRSDTRMVGGGFFGLPGTPESIKRSKWEEWSNPQLDLKAQEYWHNELQKVYDYWCTEFH
jgi:hypothetical protein